MNKIIYTIPGVLLLVFFLSCPTSDNNDSEITSTPVNTSEKTLSPKETPIPNPTGSNDSEPTPTPEPIVTASPTPTPAPPCATQNVTPVTIYMNITAGSNIHEINCYFDFSPDTALTNATYSVASEPTEPPNGANGPIAIDTPLMTDQLNDAVGYRVELFSNVTYNSHTYDGQLYIRRNPVKKDDPDTATPTPTPIPGGTFSSSDTVSWNLTICGITGSYEIPDIAIEARNDSGGIIANGATVSVSCCNQKPIVNGINAPPTGIIGASINFSPAEDSDTDGTITEYIWNFGDSSTGNTRLISYTYNNIGNYTVTLQAKDNDGAYSDADPSTPTDEPVKKIIAIGTPTPEPIVTATPTPIPVPPTTTSILTYESLSREQKVVCGVFPWNNTGRWSSNPLSDNVAPGIIGLLYEPLYIYNPIQDTYNPHLASRQIEWSSQYAKVTIREGITWSDGNTLNADDVVYTYKLAWDAGINCYYSCIRNFLSDVTRIDKVTIKFSFAGGIPAYHQLKYWLNQIPIIPNRFDVSNIGGMTIPQKTAGAYTLVYNDRSFEKYAFMQNPTWWGKKVPDWQPFGHSLPPCVEITTKRPDNNNFTQFDICNFSFRELNNITIGPEVQTFYRESPYMYPDNTVLLFFNTKKQPFNNRDFRRAIAYAINTQLIVSNVCKNYAMAAHSSGLLTKIKSWEGYVHDNVIDKLGFSYNENLARTILPNHNYPSFTIAFPESRGDWAAASKIISDNLRRIGLDARPVACSWNEYNDIISEENFDLILSNKGSSVSATPWTYWNFVINDMKGYYVSQDLTNLLKEFDKTPPEKSKSKEIAAEIEGILLEEMPSIPLWYEPAWFVAGTSYWKNYPNATNNQIGEPLLFNGKWQVGGLGMILTLIKAD